MATERDSPQDDGIDIPPRLLEKLLRPPNGPLKHVENVVIPDLLDCLPGLASAAPAASKRGRKSSNEWRQEMRRAWGNRDREGKLQESWLASLPPVQRLAASKYGGAYPARGMALRELLKEAQRDAEQYVSDTRIRTLLQEYPDITVKNLGEKFGLSREHVSRHYLPIAVNYLTLAFQRLLEGMA